MKNKFSPFFKSTFLVLALAAMCVSMAYMMKEPKISGSGIVVVVNKENPISGLTASEVKLYWLRKVKKRWPELNKNIKPADRKNRCPEQDIFYDKVLGMSAADVESYFIQKQYGNAEKPQDKFSNDNDILEFVATEPGAIGFVNKNALNPNVKVVFTLE